MKMKKNGSIITAAGILCTVGISSAYADFAYDGSTTAGWSVDRYAPSSFVSGTAPDSSTALATTISSGQDLNNRPSAYQYGFYNTQGYQAAVNGTTGNWSLSEDLYVTSDMLAGSSGPISSELWGSTGNQSGFYCMTFLSGMSARDINASPSASSQIGVFDNTTGIWSYYSTAGMSVGWNDLSISWNGISVVYSVDGVIMTSQGSNITSQDPEINNLTTAYLEDYNEFGQGSFPTEGQTTVYRDNVTALTGNNVNPVPEPTTVFAGALMLLPFGMSAFRTMRKSRAA